VWGDDRSRYVEVQSDERVRIQLDTVEGTTVAGLVGRGAVTGETYFQLVRNGALVCESAAAVTLDELVVDGGEVSSLALEVEADCGGSRPVVARVDFDEVARHLGDRLVPGYHGTQRCRPDGRDVLNGFADGRFGVVERGDLDARRRDRCPGPLRPSGSDRSRRRRARRRRRVPRRAGRTRSCSG
jgi:hypothetical protein